MAFQPDPQVAETIPRLKSIPLDGEVWKHAFASQPPTAANNRGARWNPPDVPAIYVAMERETALAEGAHLVTIQPHPIRRGRAIHRMRVAGLRSVLDLRDADTLNMLGVADGDLAESNFAACQRVGGTAEWLGHDGLLVPSARADGVNLVIFERKASESFELEPIDSEPVGV